MLLNAKEHIDCGLCSVILPVYNSAEYLDITIQSILNQTYRNLEVIILDDCSSDDSFYIAKKYAFLDNRIKVIKLKFNQGCAEARNLGLKEAMGDYIAFIDSDDVWQPNKLEKQIKILQRGDVGLSYTAYNIVNDEGNMMKSINVKCNINLDGLLKENTVVFSSVVCKVEVIEKLKFEKRWYHEDYIFLLTLLNNNIKFMGINEKLVNYRVHNNSRSFNKWNAAKYRWKIYREYLQFNFFRSLKYYFWYGINGIKKYYL